MDPLVCHLMIGPPASGKSWLADQLALRLGATVIATDAIRAELWGSERIQGDWAEIETRVEQGIRDNLLQRRPVIIDATHARREWRSRWLRKQDGPVRISWMGWWLQTPVQTCLFWNTTRARRVPDDVILRFSALLADPFEQPNRQEGFDRLVMINPVEDDVEHQIDSALKKKPRQA